MIETHCTNCRRVVRLDDSFLGKRVSCLGCGREFTVAKSRAPSTAGAADGKPAPSRAAEHLAAGLASNQPSLVKSAKPYRNAIVGGLAALIVIAGIILAIDFSRSGSPDDNSSVPPARPAPQGNGGQTRLDGTAGTFPSDGGANSRSPATGNRIAGRNDPAGVAKPASGNGSGVGSQPPASIAASTTLPQGNASNTSTNPATTPAGTNTTPASARPVSPPSLPLPGAALEKLRHVSVDGLLLRQSDELSDFVSAPASSELSPEKILAVPLDFRGDVLLEPNLGQLTILGGTSLQIGAATDSAAATVLLERGHVAFLGNTLPSKPGPALVLSIAGEAWLVQGLTGDAVFGVEAIPREPSQHEQDLRRDSFTGGLFVVKGQVRLTDGLGRASQIDSNHWLSLSPADRPLPVVGTPPPATANDPPSPPPLPAAVFRPLPSWLDLETAKGAATDDASRMQVRAILCSDRGALAELEAALPEANPELTAQLASAAALIGPRSLMLSLLAESPVDAARTAAAHGLRSRMPQSRQQRGALQQELTDVFGDKSAATVYRLLWGFNLEDAANMFTCYQLIDWLNHDQLAVRHLAWMTIRDLAGEVYPYDPAAGTKERRDAIKAWQQHVAKQGSLTAQP